jgi:acyl carrier protein
MSSTIDLPQKLIDYLNEARAPLPPISDPDEPLRIDSLSLMRLVSFLETDLAIRVEDEELTVDNFETARSLANLIGPKMKAHSGSNLSSS